MSGDFDLPDDLVDDVDVYYMDEDDAEEENVELIEDQSVLTLTQHKQCVFRANFSHSHLMIVSGGQDDTGFVWNLPSGDISFECTGHKDTVTEASFSYDDKYVATGDMSGYIQIWNVGEKTSIWELEDSDLEWMFWHHSAPVLFAGFDSGDIYMAQVKSQVMKILPSGNRSKCCAGLLLQNGSQLLAGYADGTIRLWDLKTANVICQVTISVNDDTVTNMQLSPDGKLAAICALSSGLVIIKTTDLKTVAILKGADAIETAAFCPDPELPIIASGSLKGEICLWDVGRQTLRHQIPLNGTISQMLWGNNATLFSSCVDGHVYVHLGKNGNLVAMIPAHNMEIHDMKLTKEGGYLLTASEDATLKMFDVTECLKPPEHPS